MLEISPSGRDDMTGSVRIQLPVFVEVRFSPQPTRLSVATDVRPAGLRLVSLRGIRARWGPLALSRAARRGTG